jgi:hypothetical protein
MTPRLLGVLQRLVNGQSLTAMVTFGEAQFW